MADVLRRRVEVGWLWAVVLLGLWVWFSVGALAQVAQPDGSVGEALRNLASRAGVAFTGRVVEIDRKGGVVEVVFNVEQPLLGDVGATYTLREWGGLWAAGQQRYAVGERVAVFLHAPGKSGLSSPVDGMEGIVPVVQESADGEPLLDVQRLAARVRRSVGEPIVDAANGAMALADAKAVVAGWNRPLALEPVRRPLPVGVVPVVVRLPVGVAR
jgi:hypothetical protein